MTKKGIVSTQMVVAVIAIFVLLVLGVIFAPKAFGDVGRFFTNLPGFNNSVPEFRGSDVIRYNLLTGGVEYFTGGEGIPLEGSFILGDKLIDAGDTKQKFFDYYFNGERDTGFFMSINREKFYSQEMSSYVVLDLVPIRVFPGPHNVYDRIFVQIGLFQSDESVKKFQGSLVYVFDEGIYFEPVGTSDILEFDNFDSLERELFVKKTIEWRDSVFSKPIKLSYIDEKGKGKIVEAEYRVELIDNYLVVRMDSQLN